MKALVKMQEGAGNWAVIDKPEPKPGEGQVKIKVEYIGICGSDIHTYEGHYNVNAKGLTIGHEFAGVVAEVGPGVTNVKVATALPVKRPLKSAVPANIARLANTTFALIAKPWDAARRRMAQYILARAQSCHILPENVTTRQASITEAACCAYHAYIKPM